MAIIKVSEQLICQILQEHLILPKALTRLELKQEKGKAKWVEIKTELEGFEKTDQAMPIYYRDIKQKVHLKEFQHAK